MRVSFPVGGQQPQMGGQMAGGPASMGGQSLIPNPSAEFARYWSENGGFQVRPRPPQMGGQPPTMGPQNMKIAPPQMGGQQPQGGQQRQFGQQQGLYRPENTFYERPSPMGQQPQMGPDRQRQFGQQQQAAYDEHRGLDLFGQPPSMGVIDNRIDSGNFGRPMQPQVSFPVGGQPPTMGPQNMKIAPPKMGGQQPQFQPPPPGMQQPKGPQAPMDRAQLHNQYMQQIRQQQPFDLNQYMNQRPSDAKQLGQLPRQQADQRMQQLRAEYAQIQMRNRQQIESMQRQLGGSPRDSGTGTALPPPPMKGPGTPRIGYGSTDPRFKTGGLATMPKKGKC